MRKKIIVRTNNKEIYEKFNYLHFSPSIFLENTNQKQLNKILKSFNQNGNILEIESVGNKFIVRKKSPLNFQIYLK